jgi:hypothetical protein
MNPDSSTQQTLETVKDGMKSMMELAQSSDNGLQMVAVGFAGVLLGALLTLLVGALKKKT